MKNFMKSLKKFKASKSIISHRTQVFKLFAWAVIYMTVVTATAVYASGSRWEQLPGAAKDIGISADGSVWVIGTDPVGGGYGIYEWEGMKWKKIDGGAVRIAVDPTGNPWVVNSGGVIYQRSNGKWKHIPGAAKDIGIGSDGSVWVIGIDPAGGGYGIHEWKGMKWKKIDGGAVQISVDKNGMPWVVNSNSSIFRRR